jgi:hypothetical protein
MYIYTCMNIRKYWDFLFNGIILESELRRHSVTVGPPGVGTYLSRTSLMIPLPPFSEGVYCQILDRRNPHVFFFYASIVVRTSIVVENVLHNSKFAVVNWLRLNLPHLQMEYEKKSKSLLL